MVKAILLDMDGVLVDSTNAWFALFNKTLKHFENKTISREEFETEIRGSNFATDVERYFHVTEKEVLDFFKLHESILKKDLLFEDTKETLIQLQKKKFQLAVVTNTPRNLALDMLKNCGIFDFFDSINCYDDVKEGKPAPDLILRALKELKVGKKDAWFVGDTLNDELAAKAAGILYVGFGRNGNKRIEKLSELLASLG